MSEFCDIYDRLNEQPHLQEIIRQKYYWTILGEEQKENHREVVDILNYTFCNVRRHHLGHWAEVNEKEIWEWLKEAANYFEVNVDKANVGFRWSIFV